MNRVCDPGSARAVAVELALGLCAHPTLTMRTDRRSAIEQWSLSHDDALANETALGLVPLRAGEALRGASRFVDGAGRHGA
ncbi:MAG: hypothetical protein R2698_06830 [Microthrixaceae bacterium]